MAARIVHHAAAERLLKCVEFKNPDRFRYNARLGRMVFGREQKGTFFEVNLQRHKKDLRFNSILQQIRTEGDDR